MVHNKRTIKQFKTVYFNKYPNSKIEIIKLSEKLDYKNKKTFVFIRDNYGICEVSKGLLLANNRKGSIKTAINKEKYLTNQIKEKFPENLEHYKIIKYTNAKNVLVENIYGICLCNSTSILKGSLPSIQTAINKTEYFINELKILHGDKYTYENTIYIKDNEKVLINCLIHGNFEIIANSILNGCGCAKCKNEKLAKIHSSNPIGWTKTNWFSRTNKSKNFDSFKVYIIKCFNENEEFYKIGRTFQTTKKRFSSKTTMPYNYEIIKIYEFKGLNEENCNSCYDLETNLKQINKENKYTPLLKFDGMQECFLKIKNYANN